MNLASRLIEELRADEEKRRLLARLLVPEAYGDQELRIAVLNAIYSDIATKEDIRRLEERLDKRISRIKERIDSLVKWVIGMPAATWATLAAVLIASLPR